MANGSEDHRAGQEGHKVLVLVSVIVLVDVSFYSAIAPLLPSYADDLSLSKGQAGALVGAYALGTFLASLPAGWLAGRLGARPTVVVGLAVLAVASVAFGFAESFAVLTAARFLQGVGGAASWAAGLAWLVEVAPRDRRGQMIGTVLGAGVAGAVGGPLLGALAEASSPEAVFGFVGVLAVGLAGAVILSPATGRQLPVSGDLRLALREPAVRIGAWLNVLPALFFGVLAVLVPLRLDGLDAGTAFVAGVFLCAAAVEAVASPLAGRASDRGGRALPLRVGLVGVVVACVALPWPQQAWLLGVTVVAAAAVAGVVMAPASALLSDGAESAGLGQGLAFGLYNLAWAAGQGIGSAGGARLADDTTDAVPYLTVAVLAATTLLVMLTRRPAWASSPNPEAWPSRTTRQAD